MNRLFVSDLHLSEDTPQIERAFYGLLSKEDIDELIILGDFFEVWVGDDEDSPLADRVREALRAFTDSGPHLKIARGNRDFLLGTRFTEQTGAQLLGDETILEVAGSSALLMHGDLLCTDDTDYQAFRKLAHDPVWQADALAKPLEERRQLAKQLRAMSIDAASNKPEDIMDVNELSVRERMAAAGVTRLIHGHTHRPDRHVSADGERIVLGDWTETGGWLLRESGAELSLESFSFD